MATPTVVRAPRQRAAIAELLGGLSDFRSSQHIHHHRVCRSCGNTVEVVGPAVDAWADKMADEHGFSDVRHALENFGTYGSCRVKG